MRGRVKQLDILRAVAVILVLFYHWPEDTVVPQLVKPFKTFGWSGVDLFFVLSGFVVSGLLFKEYKSTGKVDIGRFLVRRGFKIYPAFYVLIGFTLLLLAAFSGLTSNQKALSVSGVAGELFFLQNYVGSLWEHTWSLAVEEHFYFSLSIVILLLARLRKAEHNPFRRVVPACAVIAGLCLMARSISVLSGSAHHPMQATHLRIDALAFGVLLSFLYHFHSDALAGFVSRRRGWILVSSMVLVLPVWLMDYYNPVNLSIGLTMLYRGSPTCYPR